MTSKHPKMINNKYYVAYDNKYHLSHASKNSYGSRELVGFLSLFCSSQPCHMVTALFHVMQVGNDLTRC